MRGTDGLSLMAAIGLLTLAPMGAAQAQSAQDMTLLRHQRRLRQRRGSRRPRGRGPALPDPGRSRRHSRQDVARLSLDASRGRRDGRQRQGPHRPRAVAERQGRGHRQGCRGPARASNNLTKQTALTEKGEMVKGRGDQPNQHDILTGSQPDGTRLRRQSGHDLRQLDEERHRGCGHDGPSRPHGPGRLGAGQVLELVARDPRRLQPGCPARHRRRRPVLLLRGELIRL